MSKNCVKYCSGCKSTKPIEQFSRNRVREDGYSSQCRLCVSLYDRARRESKIYERRKKSLAKTWRQNNIAKQLLRSAKARAKLNNLEFNLELSDIIVPILCPVFGTLLKPNDRGMSDNSPTLDRVDPNKGYIKGNIAVISWRANTLKKNGSVEEFQKLLDWMKNQPLVT